MAVIVRETMDFGAGPQELEVFLPKRPLSKREREQAERLDDFLRRRIPEIAEEMRIEGTLGGREMERWHALGRRLAFVDDPSIVDPDDLANGHIWKAIRQYCPPELRPKPHQESDDGGPARREGTPLDHYNHCYLLGKQDPSIATWLPRWTDWFALVESPGILRDPRLLPVVLAAIIQVGRPLARGEFRQLLKELRSSFSTKPVFRDTRGLDEAPLTAAIQAAVRRVVT